MAQPGQQIIKLTANEKTCPKPYAQGLVNKRGENQVVPAPGDPPEVLPMRKIQQKSVNKPF